MIPTLVVAIVAVAFAAWVLAPLKSGRRIAPTDTTARLDDALARKRRALEAIIDLERERDAGKLSATDLDDLKRDHEKDALEALREIELLQQADADALEDEIAAVRERLACPVCGAPRAEGLSCACEG